MKHKIKKRILLLAIITYVFLVSIKLMGASFKLFGKEIAEQLITTTANPFIALLIGILATSLVQSSSATTSVIVGLTATGNLTVAGAIPMIMGANIGTSITNTIVSLAHITKKKEFRKAFEVATIHDFFNFIAVAVLFPIELIFHPLEKSAIFLTQWLTTGTIISETILNPLDYIVKPTTEVIINILQHNTIIMLALGIGLLFWSLQKFVKTAKPIAETEFKQGLQKKLFNNQGKTFALGLITTITVQSSSVSTSLIVPLAGLGVLKLKQAFPYIIGANIGTTVTALLAALITTSPAAITVAITHLLFNIFGSAVVYPIREVPTRLSRKMAAWSLKSKIAPIAYITGIFYIIPSIIIFFFH